MSSRVFYGEKLRLARLLNGYTQQKLGELVSTTRQYIHQLESDLKQPADDVLDALCESLCVRESFFITPPGNDVKFEQCHFRKRKTTPVGLANKVLAYSTIFEEFVSYLNLHLELPAPNFPTIPHSDAGYTNNEIELAAEECRKRWKLGINTPISNVTKLLENQGVVITEYNGVSDKVDALSVNRKFPIIVRNNVKESVCRMRFDLAHECGHFVLHEGIETGDNITEQEANKFASAFLFPRVAFDKEFPDFRVIGRMNWATIYELKIRWGMSAKALIYRAHHLKKITAQQYRSANVFLNRSGQSKVEKYDEIMKFENPTLIVNAIKLLNQHLGIDFNVIADELGVNVDLLSSITSIFPPANQINSDKIVKLRIN
jgi:Zn-dependent peptidase ImmA (M78 family)/transcriptional regulator with XRE-family HTH domain